MYDELVKNLSKMENSEYCAIVSAEDFPAMQFVNQAADAIEELQKDLERSKDFEAFWQHEAEEALKKFQVAISNKPRWIPVTERLPEEAGKYLVCGRWRGKQTEIWVCEFMTLSYLKGWANNAANPCVSHWMPLPEPPKEE